MKRSVGVTVAAILTLLGSILTLAMGTLFVVVLPEIAAAAPPAELAPKLVMYFTIAMFFGGALWGIATAIGLFRRQNWSRISAMIVSVLLLVVAVPGAAIFLAIPFPAGSQTPENALLIVKLIMVLFYAVLAAIGVWWLILFTRKAVKQEFRHGQAALESGMPAADSGRPVSIAIIAWFLVIGSAMSVFCVFLHLPAMLFGTFLTGWGATALFAALGATGLVIGVGLLRLRESGRIAAICYFVFGLANSIAILALPGREARWTALLQAANSSMGITAQPMPAWPPPSWMMSVGLVPSLVITILVLWLLITRKPAFQRRRPAESV